MPRRSGLDFSRFLGYKFTAMIAKTGLRNPVHLVSVSTSPDRTTVFQAVRLKPHDGGAA